MVDDEVRKKDAAAYLDDQVASGAMTQEQFDLICMQLSMGSHMTGNLQEAYEMAVGKPLPRQKFLRWLEETREGRWYKAVWVLLRKGKLDPPYIPPPQPTG